jgi:hypothetical protein
MRRFYSLFEQKGLTKPDQPTFDDVAKFAVVLNNKADGFYGLALRGQPGWGENMAIVDTMANSFGATWFDMTWHPTLDTPEWKNALSTYVNLVQKYGPPGVTSNGFNENLTLFAGGKAAMWVAPQSRRFSWQAGAPGCFDARLHLGRDQISAVISSLGFICDQRLPIKYKLCNIPLLPLWTAESQLSLVAPAGSASKPPKRSWKTAQRLS